MEHRINCFEWQNHSSEFLDGTLPEKQQQKAEKHLETCKECRQRSKHYQLLLTSIRQQKKATLPPHLEQPAFRLPLSRTEWTRLHLSRWEVLPWHLRTLIEGVGIVFVILFGISSAPKIRAWYQKSMENNVNHPESIALTDSFSEGVDSSVPPLAENPARNSQTLSATEELNGEDDTDENDIRVGRAQLWRFTLKTVSPDELRPQVIQGLKELGIPSNTPGLGGMQVPGGIEFDLILPQSFVSGIKHTLEKLITDDPNASGQKSNPPEEAENFSWYKVKSKRKIPEDQSQVVIWLPQPN